MNDANGCAKRDLKNYQKHCLACLLSMDPSTAVATDPVLTLIGFAAVIALLLFLIAKWRWHVFLALLVPIILFGIIPGVQQNNFIKAFETGFGNTLGKIGVVIVLGSIIAEALKHTGAIQVITRSMVYLVGKKRMPLALTLAGFILGIAIFSDVAYVILNPLVHSAAHVRKDGNAVIALLLFLIAKWWWHVFLALLVPIILFGIIPGVQQNNFIKAFETGFGNTLGKIGVVIVLGSIIAEALKHTGAIQVITRSMVYLVGKKRMPLALTLAGFILGIAIFSDVAYVILNPLVHSAAHATGVGISVMSTGLVGALQLTHAIVPPTPGPLAAAALVGADIGKTIIFGSIACLFGSLASWIWGRYLVGPRITTPPSAEFAGTTFLDDPRHGPPATTASPKRPGGPSAPGISRSSAATPPNTPTPSPPSCCPTGTTPTRCVASSSIASTCPSGPDSVR